MAAYAAVVSLMNTINNIHIHPRFSTCFSNKQIESLCDIAGFLLDFIESYNYRGSSKEVEDLEAKIASAAHAAEDVLELHIVDQILSGDPDGEGASAAHATRDLIGSHTMDQILTGSTEEDPEGEGAFAAGDVIESHVVDQIPKGSTKINRTLLQKIREQFMKLLPPRVMRDLQKVTRDMDSIKAYITTTFQDQQSTPPPPSLPEASSRLLVAGMTSMVGFEEYLIQLMDKLTWPQSHQQVIPIIGMGGVGKTTLARNAFDNLLIKQKFDIRAWATISQNYSTREILFEILSSQEYRRDLDDLNVQELGKKLHKCLFDRRYLIILDDMWSIDVWDGIKFFFPDNNNGGRIVVTTRLLNVAVQLNSSYLPVNLLDEDKSWKLFCQETFGKEGCPAELEEVGKKICENCKGLPLSIVVIGGFLQKTSKSREYWEGIARDTYSVLNSEGDNQCMDILSLSYNHLPTHLKPCFLYMGIFAEDEQVLVTHLVKLWVAEGFLKPNNAQSMEEVAVGYLKDLVGKNLILVNRWGSNGNIKACKIHDLIRELCLSLAEKENFFCLIKTPRVINKERRIIISESLSNGKVIEVLVSVSLVRSRICTDKWGLDYKLLRVLRAVEDAPESHFLEADPSHVNLRFLYLIYGGSYSLLKLYIHKKISLLWNLQTLPLPRVICDLQKVTKDMDSIKAYITTRFQDQQSTPPPSLPAVASRLLVAGKTSMVGFEEYLIQLMDKLTCQQSHQQVIPIIGMGGVGKTTLARNAFDNLLIKQHFDVRAWATISQSYSTREILLEILSSLEDRRDLVDLNEHELGEKLYKCLFNRRYLIILDDMWSIEVWDGIKFFFPDNSNGSRIVVTTRLVNVAVQLNSSFFPVNLLDEDKSWKLFCQETFGKEGCPAELEEVGKKICQNCKGLPLSIVVIGGFLRKSSKSREQWGDVARDTYSILNSEGDSQCMNILSLSYNYLSAHLKPCFLYMGTFAEDKEVLVSRLVQFWVAEGFLKPNDAQSMEEVAVGYLEDLVARNLILVNRWRSNGNIKACKIHDLIRELCLSLAEKENFFCVMKSPRAINRERRIIIHESLSNAKVFDVLGSVSLVRSWICNDKRRLDSKLLKVLRAVDDAPKSHFLEADLSNVNLRFLDLRYVSYDYLPSVYFPKKISLLWNLQTLRIERYYVDFVAPSEIWEMVQLRHVQVGDLYVPDPPQNGRGDLVLPNLQTLCKAMNFRLIEEVYTRIPNVKKLNLEYGVLPQGCDAGTYYCSQNLGQFHKLESLNLRFGHLNWLFFAK